MALRGPLRRGHTHTHTHTHVHTNSGGTGNCKASIKVGFYQANAAFTRSQCKGAPSNARSVGLGVATDAEGNDLFVEVPKAPTLAQAVEALTVLRTAGVNVITACTYSSTASKMIEALQTMDWAPFSASVSATVDTQSYADVTASAENGYANEFVLGYSIWHKSNKQVGEWTGIDSAAFVQRYADRYQGAKPSYHGAAQFGVGAALMRAIELANSTDTAKVTAQLRGLQLNELYADIHFDQNGQIAAPMLVLQFQGNASKVRSPEASIVYPAEKATVPEIQFPMPSWDTRKCWATCSATVGHCTTDGTCVCGDGWQGPNCEQQVVTKIDHTATQVLGGVLGPICGILILIGLYQISKFVRQAMLLKREEAERRKTRCVKAIESQRTLLSPAYLFTLRDFTDMGRIASHEEFRDAGKLVVIDNYEELREFARLNRVIFVSHQWISWAEPDPENLQYQHMLAACLAVAKKEGVEPANLYIFVDYTSIPQKNMRQKVNAISTLGVYAALFHYFIVVAPPTTHKDTKKVIDMVSYQKRGWCRMEQWGHLCSHGMKDMYGYDAGGLCDLVEQDQKDRGDALGEQTRAEARLARRTSEQFAVDGWFRDSIMVLDGDYTNQTDADRELMVDIILGLYAMVLTANERGCSSFLGVQESGGGVNQLYKLILSNFDRVFPPLYFKDYPKILEQLVHEQPRSRAKGKKGMRKKGWATAQRDDARAAAEEKYGHSASSPSSISMASVSEGGGIDACDASEGATDVVVMTTTLEMEIKV